MAQLITVSLVNEQFHLIKEIEGLLQIVWVTFGEKPLVKLIY